MSINNSMEVKQILIVEDNPDIVDLIQLHLEDMNYEVDVALDGQTGLEKGLKNNYDLILLDLTLPYKDGLEISQTLRENQIETPILMLTARSEEIDKVAGMNMGANYYITKPFSISELKIGISKLLAADDYKVFELNREKFECGLIKRGELEIDTNTKEVLLNSKPLELEEKEYLLLALLACQPGKAFSRSEILKTVWGYDINTLRHTVTSYIGKLRKKIEPDFQNPKYIVSAERGGYKFNETL